MLTPAKLKRFRALQEKYHTPEGLTSKEEIAYEDLCGERQEDLIEMIPTPTCCKAARKYPAVTYKVNVYDGEDSHKAKGQWTIALHSELSRSRSMGDRSYYKRRPEPKFCPYCGTPLPEMKRKSPVPKTVCRVTDGGYDCDTCKESLNTCLCDPIESAFEPVV